MKFGKEILWLLRKDVGYSLLRSLIYTQVDPQAKARKIKIEKISGEKILYFCSFKKYKILEVCCAEIFAKRF